MKKSARVLITAFLAIGLNACAQESPPRPPGATGQNPGQPPGPGMPFRSSLGMLTMSEVQTELKLTEEQKAAGRKAAEGAQESIRQLFDSMIAAGPAGGPPQFEEIGKKIEEINRKAEDTFAAMLNDEQRRRYQQLRVQQEGLGALLRPEVSRTLELSEPQIAKLREISQQNQPFLPPEERSRIERDANAVLTAAQKSAFDELKGTAFQFPQADPGPPGFGPPGFGPPGFGPPGMGGPGGMMGQNREIVADFDQNADGWLNVEERAAARKSLESSGGGGRRFGPPGGFGGREEEPVSPGEKIDPSSVTASDAPFYDPQTVRTIFLTFENADWEKELETFNNTDVEVPATLMCDGETYKEVGVHFRGMSSFGMVQAGHKRSLNLTMDFLNEDQELHGYRTINLLNSHEDPSFLHTVLYLQVARNYIPAPKANFVRVVINGESWGLYINAQQFNKEFLKENFSSSKGTRWKVQGSPGGRGGLEFLGDDIGQYERIYSMKSGDGEKAWRRLISLCRILNETPAESLEEALNPILDIDGALWFLALENALINSDGYWVRASDYCLFLDGAGKFHIIPHDANETFQPGMGPGMGRGGRGGPGGFGGPGFGPGPGGPGFGPERGQRPPLEGEPDRNPEASRNRRPEGPGGRAGERSGPGQGRESGGRGPGQSGPGFAGPGMGGGVTLDPLIGLDDNSKPLRSKLLAVPKFRQQYLSYVRTIAEDQLDWNRLQPVIDEYVKVISPYVEADTRKLSSFAAFQAAVNGESVPAGAQPAPASGPPGFGGPFGRGPRMSLRQFADQRREFLLRHAEIKEVRRVDYQRPVPPVAEESRQDAPDRQ